MKKSILIVVMIALAIPSFAGHDIAQSMVPSVVLNSFQNKFPKTYDVDWEGKGELYKVEFEVNLFGADHEAWFDRAGKLIEHKQEIGKNDLPRQVLSKIDSDFARYRVDDVDRIARGKDVVYRVELKTYKEELKVTFDATGKIISQFVD